MTLKVGEEAEAAQICQESMDSSQLFDLLRQQINEASENEAVAITHQLTLRLMELSVSRCVAE